MNKLTLSQIDAISQVQNFLMKWGLKCKRSSFQQCTKKEVKKYLRGFETDFKFVKQFLRKR